MSRFLCPRSVFGCGLTYRKTLHIDLTLKNHLNSFGCRYCKLLRKNQTGRRLIWKCRSYSNGQTRQSHLSESSQKTSKALDGGEQKLTVITEEMHKELIQALNSRVSNMLNKTSSEGVVQNSCRSVSSELSLSDEGIQNSMDSTIFENILSETEIHAYDEGFGASSSVSKYPEKERNIQEDNYLNHIESYFKNETQTSVFDEQTYVDNMKTLPTDIRNSQENILSEKEVFKQNYKKFDESLRKCVNTSLEVSNADVFSEDTVSDKFRSKSEEKSEILKQTEFSFSAETLSDSLVNKKNSVELLQEQKEMKSKLHELKMFNEKLTDISDNMEKHFTSKTSKQKHDKLKRLMDLKDNNLKIRQQENFWKNLKAFISACVDAGKSQFAKSTIKHYVNNQIKRTSNKKITDSSVFHRLLYVFAKQGNINSIKEIFLMMSDINVKPSFQCYAAYLECLGRQKNINTESCESLLNNITKENYILEDIFKESVIINDSRTYILKAINTVRPDFVPNKRIEDYEYSGPLLGRLNEAPSQNEVIEANPYGNTVDSNFLKQQLKLQLEWEKASFVKVKCVTKNTESSEKTKELREKLEEFKELWKSQLREGFRQKLELTERKKPRLSLYPYFKIMDVDDYIELMIKEILVNVRDTDSFSTATYMAARLGMQVYNRYHIKKMDDFAVTDKILKMYEDYADYYSSSDLQFNNFRAVWQHLMQKHIDGTDLDGTFEKWPHFVINGVGKALYEIILQNCKMDAYIHRKTTKKNMVPAFYTTIKKTGFKQYVCIKAHPALCKLYTEADLSLSEMEFDVKEMPMLVPPIPWCSPNVGGFLIGPTSLIRLPSSASGQEEKIGNMHPSQLYPVMDALNILSACAWKVNKPVLDIAIDLFNNKGNKDLSIPPPISECPPPPKIDKTLPTPELLKQKYEHARWKQLKNDMFGLWCTELYRLSIANKFRDEIFWFPNNVDFRGRTYPCPPHFNQLGNDVSRAFLIFAKGKPLGSNGLDWLKIHLINLTGLKKRCSMNERLQYANEIMPDILDSADYPMEGRKWWQKSDEPWQTLACCMEIAKASRTPDPSKYICHFPVHQDGSCNGLQHYAALGRDQSGAESVNLHPFDCPKDVYSDVCELVEEERKKDAENGSEVAKLLEGHVTRNVIKQTIMTTVYGVTRFGARRQICGQLQDKKLPDKEAWQGSSYLTVKVFYCLQKMFTAAREIQDWLTLSSYLISFLCKKPVEWITPIGFPVVQPYHKKITLRMFDTIHIDNHSVYEKPNVMKQKNGFPPNFIHSLDSTHMMLTALYCFRTGINYVSVHDCFWTHPCDTEIMNKITREQFVALHNQPILENLSQHLLTTFSTEESFKLLPFEKRKIIQDCCKLLKTEINNNNENSNQLFSTILQSVPEKGKFDLNNVLKSVYFFS